MLPHERALLEQGKLSNITHHGASSIWLERPAAIPADEEHTLVYRPMGDAEVLYLVQNGRLPDTQPYQAIIEGPVGREYANKYLVGQKWTDTHPTTIVEFAVEKRLVEGLKARQCKVEDGAISMGLGDKAGGGLVVFNRELEEMRATYEIVKVKRAIKKK
uniref:Uncharacterized protein n=1 Tax=Arcella intermedia TaxID=1963864 RepID=A0A6B2LKT8_9EUKA